MHTESESISVGALAAPAPTENTKIYNSRTESGSSGPYAAEVATLHSLEEPAKTYMSEFVRD